MSRNYTGQAKRQNAIFGKVIDFIREYIYIPLTILVAYLLFGVIFVIGVVPTESMEPTYNAGSVFIGTRLVDKAGFDRGDVALFKYDEKTVYVKRVVGLPGDTIAFVGGNVYINDELLDESSYLPAGMTTESDLVFFEVPEGCYFMLGDNRDYSYDSRYWAGPYVSYDRIVGTIFFAAKLPWAK